MKLAPIVEGHGEVSALPILIRRIQQWKFPEFYLDIPPPIRVRRDRFLNKEEDFERHILLASKKSGSDGWILILLDADDDCPISLGEEILRRAEKYIKNKRISVVIANREYEAWFIASAEALNGHRGFRYIKNKEIDAEKPRNAKGWMGEYMPAGYSETVDQPSFSALMDLELAHKGSRSFRKLCKEIIRAFESK
ncbi:TPA: DUF4276 family protein [Pseudomonas aeruginosa]|nr:DUF4276 family protein [Pseudomonas aeruginosa]